MSQRHLTASGRTSLIKLASSMEKGSDERRAILARVKKSYSKGPNLSTPFQKWIGTALKSLLGAHLYGESSIGLETDGKSLNVFIYNAKPWKELYALDPDVVSTGDKEPEIFGPHDAPMLKKIEGFFGAKSTAGWDNVYDGGGHRPPYHAYKFPLGKIFPK
jgi:hypothetical protein